MKNLPWVNRIFIVMNPPKEKPSWFADNYNKYVTIVDHGDIFNDDIPFNSPVTNSNSIETALQNIPGLSEHFIYLNDDMFIGKKLPYTYFFSVSGKAVAQPGLAPQDTSNSTLGFDIPEITTGFHSHVPISIRKTSMKSYSKKYKDFIEWVRSFNSRLDLGCEMCESAGLQCPCQQFQGALSRHSLKEGKAQKRSYFISDYRESQARYFSLYNQHEMNKLKKNLLPPTFCINDSKGTKEQRSEFTSIMQKTLSRVYPEKTKFEK